MCFNIVSRPSKRIIFLLTLIGLIEYNIKQGFKKNKVKKTCKLDIDTIFAFESSGRIKFQCAWTYLRQSLVYASVAYPNCYLFEHPDPNCVFLSIRLWFWNIRILYLDCVFFFIKSDTNGDLWYLGIRIVIFEISESLLSSFYKDCLLVKRECKN